MRILIVEDEPAAARRLQKIVLELEPDSIIAGQADTITGAVAWLKANPQPDLLLLDIQLADGLSFEIFNQVDVKSPVIFTTAFDEYALRAFKVNSIDYLLKPIDREELRKSLTKYKTIHTQAQALVLPDMLALVQQITSGKPSYKKRFLVSKGAQLIPIDANDVCWLRTEERVVFLHTHDNRRFMMDGTLDELEQQLDPSQFFRANRQYIISNKTVHHVEQGFNGKLHLHLNPTADEEVIVSREKAAAFRKWIGD